MKLAPLYIFLALFIFSCNQDKIDQLETQKAEIQSEYDRLMEESQAKDEFIAEYTKTLNDVYDNLELIRKREGLHLEISKNLEKEQTPELKMKMLNNISSIDSYLKSSKKRIAGLRKKIKDGELKTTSLSEMVEGLNKVISEREVKIQELHAETEELGIRVSEVEKELENKEARIAEQTRALNTAYYVVGTEKELKTKGIIEEKGGLLGLRKTKKLAANFDPNHFTATDIVGTSAIPFDPAVKKIDIVSPHNPESYHIVTDENNQTVLEIVNPDEFWKIKYLVVLAKS